MIVSNEGGLCNVIAAAAADTNVKAGYFDRGDADYVNIYVGLGAAESTQTASITGIQICDSDTDPTKATNMTAIGVLSCSNTTSTAAMNSLPSAAIQGVNGIITEFQIDLRKRKKYIGVIVTPSTNTAAEAIIYALARLTRKHQNLGTSLATIATNKNVKNNESTAVNSCMQIVAG